MIYGEDLSHLIDGVTQRETERHMRRKRAYIDKVVIEEYQYRYPEEQKENWDYLMEVSLDVKTLDDCVALRETLIDVVARFNNGR